MSIRSQVEQQKKRGPGRPRKSDTAAAPKRKRGRPRKPPEQPPQEESPVDPTQEATDTKPPGGRPTEADYPVESIEPTVPANERPPTANEDEILPVSAVAKMLGKTPRTIKNWIETGAIQAGKFPSGLTGIRRSVVEEVLRRFPIGGRR